MCPVASKLRIEEMNSEIERSSKVVDNELSNDLISIMEKKGENGAPFMKLFWAQQKQAFTRSPTGVRWHPMIIRFVSSMIKDSQVGYSQMKNAGVLHFPSSRILRNYKNAIEPKRGFNPEVIEELTD